MSSIVLKNIKKVYNKSVTAVLNFNIDIKDREFIVLVGPSGCGKSTTLRMIAGLEDITAGELYIDGEYVNDVQPKDRNVAMVFQNYALYPHMTAAENMSFGLELRKIPKAIIKEKVADAARLLSIEKLLDRKPKQLSGGEQQRVALGRAMVRDPKVFLLDEPLSNLDAKLRNQMRVEIIDLHKRLNTTFVYVTHDQIEAMTMGDRIVVMNEGLICQIDTPQNLYRYPDNLFVAGFIGSPQMNFSDCVLCHDGGNYYATIGDDNIGLPTGKFDDEMLSQYVGKPLVLGLRPDDILPAKPTDGAISHHEIAANISLAEMIGSEVHLHMLYQNTKLVARVSSRTEIKEGQDISLYICTDKLHLFDKQTGVSLRPR